ncbi:expressed protein [Dictyostelium purpureum]|uniref:Expressed protein n=1 Tax=Dictyostelium purpureum TaxID=5786 RepID=F0ZLA8_DICPU|nr:uncharacterized protein DICPUDRAFT_92054 [Dictyostelium purpureum]EGC35270.1 expressed protein [Dictyostelium purpureum]|eukprot:XP_003288196.1 expressed protein [Dictyostelium purpureum]
MKFIQSLILLIVAFFALSSAAFTGFNVTDTTQKCGFNVPANGSCTSNSKCGAQSNTVYSYSIAPTKSASNVNNYTITGFSDAACKAVANNLFVGNFLCDANKPVSVKVNTNTVQVTCVEQKHDSSSASTTIASFAVVLAALIAALL